MRRQPLTKNRPFPGPWPYTEGDRDYFRGRRGETDRLVQLVQSNALTVLFGASGLGKSSLLLAGLFPELRDRAYFPVWIRLKFNEPSLKVAIADLSRQIMAGVREAAVPAKVEPEYEQDRDTLWEYFHALELWSETMSLLTPVVVLDQFEEVFTLGQRNESSRAAVKALFDALGELVEGRVPAAVEKRMRADAAERSRAQGEQGEVETSPDLPPAVKIVLSLREEFLPHLEDKRKQLPSVLRSHARLWLLPFKGDSAQKAIVSSAGHLVKEEVAGNIVRSVASRRGSLARSGSARTSFPGPDQDERPLEELSVEPSLLSLFCYQLNERRIRDGKKTIEAALVTTAGEDILSDFYMGCLAGLNQYVQPFVEQRLLSSAGHRLSVPVEDACSERGIDENVIRTLQERRLVRRELRGETIYLELVHDVLADTVLREREHRKEKQRIQRWKIGLGIAVSVLIAGGAPVGVVVARKGEEGLKELDPAYNEKKRQLDVQFQQETEKKTREQAQIEKAVREAEEKARQRAETAERDATKRIEEAKIEADRVAAAAKLSADSALEAARQKQAEADRANQKLSETTKKLAGADETLKETTGKVVELKKQISELEKRSRVLRMQTDIPKNLR